MKIIHIFLTIFVLNITVWGESANNTVDCLILEDENSIICKYTHKRMDVDHNVTFQWIDPSNKLSRTREMIIPALHGSVYDYRYIKGRQAGTWTFKVIDVDEEFTTNFILE